MTMPPPRKRLKPPDILIKTTGSGCHGCARRTSSHLRPETTVLRLPTTSPLAPQPALAATRYLRRALEGGASQQISQAIGEVSPATHEYLRGAGGVTIALDLRILA